MSFCPSTRSNLSRSNLSFGHPHPHVVFSSRTSLFHRFSFVTHIRCTEKNNPDVEASLVTVFAERRLGIHDQKRKEYWANAIEVRQQLVNNSGNAKSPSRRAASPSPQKKGQLSENEEAQFLKIKDIMASELKETTALASDRLDKVSMLEKLVLRQHQEYLTVAEKDFEVEEYHKKNTQSSHYSMLQHRLQDYELHQQEKQKLGMKKHQVKREKDLEAARLREEAYRAHLEDLRRKAEELELRDQFKQMSMEKKREYDARQKEIARQKKEERARLNYEKAQEIENRIKKRAEEKTNATAMRVEIHGMMKDKDYRDDFKAAQQRAEERRLAKEKSDQHYNKKAQAALDKHHGVLKSLETFEEKQAREAAERK
jgi:hypothetical protein